MRWSLLLLTACASTPAGEVPWHELFDGTSLGSWAPTSFGGEGPVRIVDRTLEIGFGNPLSGITWQGTFPPPGVDRYTLEVVAERVDGNDFFCGLTFPVGTSHLTLVVGGWGGALVGLSSLDGEDAGSNSTATWRAFENGRPYRVRVEVAPERVRAFVDGEQVVDADLGGVVLSLRAEVEPCRPLGIATFTTTARVHSVRWR